MTSTRRGRPPVVARLEEISQGLREMSDMLKEIVARFDKLERPKDEPSKDSYQPRFDRWGN